MVTTLIPWLLSLMWLLPQAQLAQQSPAIPRAQVTSPHGNLNIACENCHTFTSWRPMRAVPEFNHDKTKYPLRGMHVNVTCMQCHTSLVFSNVGTRCADCHADLHRGQFGATCEQCHTDPRLARLAGQDRATPESVSIDWRARLGGVRCLSQECRGRPIPGTLNQLLFLPSDAIQKRSARPHRDGISAHLRELPLFSRYLAGC